LKEYIEKNMKTTTLLIWSIALIAGSYAGAARSETNVLLVCNKGDQALSIINPETGGQIVAVKEDGVTGHEVVASADGRLAFVPIYGNSGVGHPGTDGQLIRVIDIERHAIVGTVSFAKGVRPHCAVIGPKDKLLYVTTELENSITVIDPKTFAILYSIPTGQIESHMLAITSDGALGYTANVKPGTVSVLDLKARKVLKVIPIAKTAQRICISPDDRWVFTADQTKPQMAAIDAKKNEVARWIELPGVGYGAAVSPDNQWLVVAMSGIRKAGLVDLKTMKLAGTVDLPKNPQEVLIRPDGKVAYVSCDASKKVAAIDLKTFKVEKLIDAGNGADGLAWAVRP
jgi:DNA-binding beta-propeller fold protein YncE